MPIEPFTVRIERQDHPAERSYWQSFVVDYAPGLNVTGVLQRIAANPTPKQGQKVSPVAYELLTTAAWPDRGRLNQVAEAAAHNRRAPNQCDPSR